jgi:hypothetical protein
VDVALESDDDHYGVTRHREFGDVLGDIALDDGRLNRLSFFEPSARRPANAAAAVAAGPKSDSNRIGPAPVRS